MGRVAGRRATYDLEAAVRKPVELKDTPYMRGLDHGDRILALAPEIRDRSNREPTVRPPDRRRRGKFEERAVAQPIDGQSRPGPQIRSDRDNFVRPVAVEIYYSRCDVLEDEVVAQDDLVPRAAHVDDDQATSLDGVAEYAMPVTACLSPVKPSRIWFYDGRPVRASCIGAPRPSDRRAR
jgi:hypothetical protein